MERSFEKEIKINRWKLDEECESHSSLYLYWKEEEAEAKKEKDSADDKLSLTLSSVEMRLREHPPEGVKITDATIKALVNSDEAVCACKDLVREAKENVYHLEAAVKAFEHRKSQLNNLVTLYATGYFSAPSTEKKKTANDEAGKEVRRKLNRRKKGE